jgi:oligopeptide/dipeptide ABC transporter ATP-binding protein
VKPLSHALILEVRALSMHFRVKAGWVRAVDEVSFSLQRGQVLGIVGESGCGKTSAALSIVRLLPGNGCIRGGEVLFQGNDLTKINLAEMRRLRWKNISIIFQGSMNALSPVHRVADQLQAALLLHEPQVSKRAAGERVAHLFELVGVPTARLRDYPHQLSGGMRQRVMIAMALVCNPDLVIADEPTTALDVIIQRQVMETLRDLQQRLQQSMILITHDMAVVAEACHHVAVMYAGRVMEYGTARAVFYHAKNPYTIGLLRSYPSIRGEIQELISMPGDPPNLANLLPGCRFAERCPLADDRCSGQNPPVIEVEPDHWSRCWWGIDIDIDRLKQHWQEA